MQKPVRTEPEFVRVPFAAYDKFHFNGAMRVVAFGSEYPNEIQPDWTLKLLRNADISESRSAAGRYLPEIVHMLGAQTVLAPSPIDFNARMCSQEELTLMREVHSKDAPRCMLQYGAKADGILLAPGKMFAISLGGCALIMAQLNNTFAVAHAGRKSVLDEVMIATKTKRSSTQSRKHQSIVDAMLESMGCRTREDYSAVRVIVFFPIAANKFEHPWDDNPYCVLNRLRSEFIAEEWGEACLPGWQDESMRRRGRIDLATLINLQFQRYGVRKSNISVVESPQTLYDTRSEPKDNRNLVLTQRLY